MLFQQINIDYALCNKYEYRIYCNFSFGVPGFKHSWGMVRLFQMLVEEFAKRTTPTYFFFADSDAYFRDGADGIIEHIHKYNVVPEQKNWTIMQSNPSNQPYNIGCGQALGYVDPTDHDRVERGLNMLEGWMRAGCSVPCFATRSSFYLENGCLNELVSLQTPFFKHALHVHLHDYNSFGSPNDNFGTPTGIWLRHLSASRYRYVLSSIIAEFKAKLNLRTIWEARKNMIQNQTVDFMYTGAKAEEYKALCTETDRVKNKPYPNCTLWQQMYPDLMKSGNATIVDFTQSITGLRLNLTG